MKQKNHPGIYMPPPLIYISFFLLSFLMQRLLPLNYAALHLTLVRAIGVLLILIYLLFFTSALRRFIDSKNTLVTIRPASSLETSGIYSFSRNPMYLSLVCLYAGLAVFLGNWWTLILLLIVILIVQLYVIKKEERYLLKAFGSNYAEYKNKVRRWI